MRSRAGLWALAAVVASGFIAADASAEWQGVTKVRFYPRAGFAARLKGGQFLGSNESTTTDFRPIARIDEAPPEGQWTEIVLKAPVLYRYLKLDTPPNSWGNVAEVEFYSGDRKLQGTPFGTAGSRNDSGNDFGKAVDGDVATFFDAADPNFQYVGIDLGPESQAAAPTFSPEPGSFPDAVTVSISSATPEVSIRFSRNQGTPSREWGEQYRGPVTLQKGTVLAAVAYADGLAASPVAVAAYRVGEPTAEGRTVRTFHVGNSLTDTVDGWLKPLSESAGHPLDFHRFTIPGAPTDWLWNHPGSGFGDSRYAQAFFVLAPIDHLFTQPFAGHNRSIENEAEYSGRFFDACRKYSPDVQMWLYCQWPGPKFDDHWSQGTGAVADLHLTPAATWQEGVANHLRYTEAVRRLMDDTHPGKPVLIVPGGTALAMLKTEMDAGRVPGMSDFFAETFADGIHLKPTGRYLISMVHYACIFKESPEGKVSALTTGLTPEQAAIYQRIAWEAVKDHKWAGVAPLPKE